MSHLIKIIRIIIYVPFLLYLPGHFIHRCFAGERDQEGIFAESLFIRVLISVLLSGWIGLILAEIGIFALKWLVLILFAISAGGWLYLRKVRRPPGPKPRISIRAIPLIILVLFTAGLFFRTNEYVITERDPGAYLVRGVNIAKEGTVVLTNEGLKERSDEELEVLWGPQPPRDNGFFLEDATTGEVSTRFFSQYSVLIAISYSLFGLKWGLFFLNPLLGLLAVFALLFCIRRIFSPAAGYVTGFLMAASILTIWFSRYIMPEIFTCFLIFSGILSLYLFTREMRPLYGVLAAGCFGMAIMSRFELFILLFPLTFIVFLFVIFKDNLLRWLWFIVPGLILVGHAVFSAYHDSYGYTIRITRDFDQWIKRGLWSLLVLVVIMSLIWLVHRFKRKIFYGNLALWLRKVVPILLAVLIVTGFIYGYFIRPRTTQTKLEEFSETNYKPINEENLKRIGWYLTLLGLILAAAGAVLLLLRRLDLTTIPFLAIAAIFSLILIYDMFNNPYQLWTMRRYMPVVIPSFMAFIGYFIAELPALIGKRKIAYVASAGLFIALIVLFLNQSKLVINYTEYKGTIGFIDKVAEAFPKDSVVLFSERLEGTYLAEPLRYIYDLDTYHLGPYPPKETLQSLIEQWKKEGKPVFLVHSRMPFYYMLDEYQVTPLESHQLETTFLERSYVHPPRGYTDTIIKLDIFAIEPRKELAYFMLDVGGADQYYLDKGFYDDESFGGLSVRWTGKEPFFWLPNLPGDQDLVLTVTAAPNPRVVTEGPQKILLWVDGKSPPLGYFLMSQEGLAPYEVVIPRNYLKDPHEPYIKFAMTVPTWNPVQEGDKEEDRDLGILIDSIELKTKDYIEFIYHPENIPIGQ